VDEVHGQRLGGDPSAMRPERLGDRATEAETEHDAISDVEARGLACVLHGAHQLTGETFSPELRCELEFQGDGDAGVARDPPALDRLLDEIDVAGPELDLVASDVEANGLATGERSGEGPVVAFERRRGALDAGPEPGAEDLEVRLGAPAPEL